MTKALRREIDFMLYDWLGAERLSELPDFEGQDRSDWDAFLDLSGEIAWNELLPCYKAADREEPWLDDGQVRVQPQLAQALRVYLDAGLHQAAARPDLGGMGLPFTIATAAMAEVMAANVAGSGFIMLSVANTRLLTDHGTPAQIAAFARPQLEGNALGTMCLSEPDTGSSLGDVTTRAYPENDDELGPRYRLSGRKMWISGGDQDVTGNVIHLVLAKVVQPDGSVIPGTKGTTLFIVPKLLPGGERNDLSVAGLNHKMGYRGTPNCLLNFGENGGATAWRLGAEGDGLRIMFDMMNEARVNVGLSGAAMAYRGFDLARQYAQERVQGRSVLDRAAERPVPIVRHPDVRRMLLVQKAIAEGALALCLKGAFLKDAVSHAPEEAERRRMHDLLSLLTPVIKSWPSEQGLVALHHAIQVHGGYGYTRDFDVEQLYRDSRLNPIHEGTTGIHAIDLLGRKILSERGESLTALLELIRHETRTGQGMEGEAATLLELCDWFEEVAAFLLKGGSKGLALANATGFLEGFGHFVLAWIWLALARAADAHPDPAFAEKKRWTCRYFYAAEVPRIRSMMALLVSAPRLVAELPDHVVSP